MKLKGREEKQCVRTGNGKGREVVSLGGKNEREPVS